MEAALLAKVLALLTAKCFLRAGVSLRLWARKNTRVPTTTGELYVCVAGCVSFMWERKR
jgi:hypothetical protein